MPPPPFPYLIPISKHPPQPREFLKGVYKLLLLLYNKSLFKHVQHSIVCIQTTQTIWKITFLMPCGVFKTGWILVKIRVHQWREIKQTSLRGQPKATQVTPILLPNLLHIQVCGSSYGDRQKKLLLFIIRRFALLTRSYASVPSYGAYIIPPKN